MKAALLENIKQLKITQIDNPKCKDRELLIKVKSCAICGTDVKVYYYGHKHIRFPRITGHEVTGEIIDKGAEISEFNIGERVAIAPAIPCGRCWYCYRGKQSMCEYLTAIGYHYDGGFAELMIVPENAVRNGCVNKIPENLSYQEATLAEPLACAINAQELSNIKLGDTVLIIGAGPLGCLHAELARFRGSIKIILADISKERLKMAEFVKADIYIDMSKEDISKKIEQVTSKRGIDKIIIACASKEAQQLSLNLVAKRGCVNFFGGLPKEDSIINFDSNLPHYKEFYVVGTHGSTFYHNELALNILASYKINAKKYISHQLSLDALLEGIKMVKEAVGLKIIITEK